MAKPKRFVFASDNHGDMIDRGAERALQEFMREFKPDIRIHGGDCFDLRCLRRGASHEETLEEVKTDIEMGMDFMKWFKPTHWLRGNHDERLVDGMNSHNPILSRFACMAWEEIYEALRGVQILPYCKRRGVLEIGTLSFVHGFSVGIYAAKRLAEVYGNVIAGHTHVVDAFSVCGLKPRVGRTAGCLCALSMDYNRAQLNTLRQSHGFCYGFLYPNGLHRVFQATVVNDVWILPTEFKEIRCA